MTTQTSAEFIQWPAVRSALLAVRDLRRSSASRTYAAERRALVKIARSVWPIVHAEVASAAEEVAYGKWCSERIIGKLEMLANDTHGGSGQASSRYVSAPTRALLGWRILVTQGLTPTELYRARPELFGTEPAATDIARRGRVQHALWIGG